MLCRRILTVAVASGCLVLALAGSAAAGQWPHERDGILLGVNLGGGSAGVTDQGYDSDRESGGAANFRIGYAFQNQFAVGLEGNGWKKEVDGETWTFSFGGPSFTFWPSGQGFFVRGAIGSGSVEYAVDLGNNVTLSGSDSGIGFLGGLGYEWRLTRKFALGPQFDYTYSSVNDNLSFNLLNFTLGANWYF